MDSEQVAANSKQSAAEVVQATLCPHGNPTGTCPQRLSRGCSASEDVLPTGGFEAGNWPALKAELEAAWTDFLDANPDDITSPEEWPNHALVTCDQMIGIVENAFAALSPHPPIAGVVELREALEPFARALETGVTNDGRALDDQECCSGQDCGCRGSTFGQRWAYELRALASAPQAMVEGEGKRIAEVMAEGDGHWSACTGCQESVDGCVSTTDYPYDPRFKSQPGGGCGECGGIGVTWTPAGFYDGIIEFAQEQDRTHDNVRAILWKHLGGDDRYAAVAAATNDILALSPSSTDAAQAFKRAARERSELRVQIQRALIAELGDAYDCTRVWSAWGVGTMGEDDFEPVLDRLDSLIDSIVAEITQSDVEDDGPLSAADHARIDAAWEKHKAAAPCQIPPEGWYCTRTAGHAGPCAAIRKLAQEATPAAADVLDGDALAREVLAIATEKCGYTLAASAIRRGQDDQRIKAHIALSAIRALKPTLSGEPLI